MKLLRVLINRVLFKFYNDTILLNVLGDMEGPLSILNDSSFGSSMLFSWHAAICFIKLCYYFFLKKHMFYFQTKESQHLTISLTCFNNFSKTDSENNEEILA